METPGRVASQNVWVDVDGLDLTPVQPMSEAEQFGEEAHNQSESFYPCTQLQISHCQSEYDDANNIYSCTQKQESSGEFDFSVTPRQDRSSEIHDYSATQVQESNCENHDDSQYEDDYNSDYKDQDQCSVCFESFSAEIFDTKMSSKSPSFMPESPIKNEAESRPTAAHASQNIEKVLLHQEQDIDGNNDDSMKSDASRIPLHKYQIKRERKEMPLLLTQNSANLQKKQLPPNQEKATLNVCHNKDDGMASDASTIPLDEDEIQCRNMEDFYSASPLHVQLSKNAECGKNRMNSECTNIDILSSNFQGLELSNTCQTTGNLRNSQDTSRNLVDSNATQCKLPPCAFENEFQDDIQAFSSCDEEEIENNENMFPMNNMYQVPHHLSKRTEDDDTLLKSCLRERNDSTYVTEKEDLADEIEAFKSDSDSERLTEDERPSNSENSQTKSKKYNRRRLRLCAEPSKLKLHSHQKLALRWMLQREDDAMTDCLESKSNGHHVRYLSGGILADDCGLSKTVSALALIAASKERMDSDNGRRHMHANTLIICPASSVHKWMTEIKTHTNLVPLAFHGPKRSRSRSIHNDPFAFLNYDVVVTTFRMVSQKDVANAEKIRQQISKDGENHSAAKWLSRNRKKMTNGKGSRKDLDVSSSFLHCVEWKRLVVDEAHMISNRNTKRYRSTDAIISKSRWCLAATPIGNSRKDLISLLTWISGAQSTLQKAMADSERLAAIESAANIGPCSVPSKNLAVLRCTKSSTQEGLSDCSDESLEDSSI